MENPFEPGKKVKNNKFSYNQSSNPSTSNSSSNSYEQLNQKYQAKREQKRRTKLLTKSTTSYTSNNYYDQLNQKYQYKYDTVIKILKFIDNHKAAISIFIILFTDYLFLFFAILFERQIVEWFFKKVIDR